MTSIVHGESLLEIIQCFGNGTYFFVVCKPMDVKKQIQYKTLPNDMALFSALCMAYATLFTRKIQLNAPLMDNILLREVSK